MNEDRRSILQMLADGQITADEAERLLAALERAEPPSPRRFAPGGVNGAPKYLRVTVDSDEPGEGGPTRINIRVPMSLLRAGVRLTSLIPPKARDQVNAELQKNGVPFDISQLRPENLEALIDQLNDLQVDVDDSRSKVRVYCE
ncbi:MAG TPA: hypothetical protein VLI41_07635 [Phenylobacterium sp.]|uniref:SHOCT-like domain-containing protein n=1 Tax=Phenylobacterium sp. TaxID=1871053 RepID=UPI002B97510A|nr:hypothetical protein [Phenylobacterium sp.]HSV03064.1 hypothetical protein [Phenylobacterium sp.]